MRHPRKVSGRPTWQVARPSSMNLCSHGKPKAILELEGLIVSADCVQADRQYGYECITLDARRCFYIVLLQDAYGHHLQHLGGDTASAFFSNADPPRRRTRSEIRSVQKIQTAWPKPSLGAFFDIRKAPFSSRVSISICVN